MTYEEIKKISDRLDTLDGLVAEVRLNARNMREEPKFWYYQAGINLRTKDGTVEVARIVISEIPGEEEVYACKNKLHGLSFVQREDQGYAYEACKGVIEDYLNNH